MNSNFSQIEFWNLSFLGNSAQSIILALLIFIISFAVLRIIQFSIIKRLEEKFKGSDESNVQIRKVIIKVIESVDTAFYIFISFVIGIQFLKLNSYLNKIVSDMVLILVTYQVILIIQVLIDYVMENWTKKHLDENTSYALDSMKKIAKVMVWILAFFVMLSNLGVNVTSLIAGLGVGGIAIALALQNILGDLFSSFAIYFDKPFQIGDFIIVGDKMGVVQKIGIKTTRIQALQGEEVVISNKELTSSQIQNFKKMQERRVVFSFGVTYETPLAQLKKIPPKVKEIILSVDNTRFDRAHFFKFADSSLYFEVVYYVKSGDYNIYMDTQQEINFKIIEALDKFKVSMAYPTQTLYISSNK